MDESLELEKRIQRKDRSSSFPDLTSPRMEHQSKSEQPVQKSKTKIPGLVSSSITSLQKSKYLQKFVPEEAEKLPTSELIRILYDLMKTRVKGSRDEATKYYQLIQGQLAVMENNLKEIPHLQNKLQQLQKEKDTWNEQFQLLKEDLNFKEEQLTKSQAQSEERKQQLLVYLKMPKDHRESETLNLKEENKKLHREITEKTQQLQQIEIDLQKQLQRINETSENFPPGKELFQDLQTKLQVIQNNTEEIMSNLKTQDDQSKAENQQNRNYSAPLYSDKIKTPAKNPTTTSKSAILLKRLRNSNVSLSTIRSILNEETKNHKDLPTIFCEEARDRNTLIIKSVSEDDTDKLLHIIEEIQHLKTMTEVVYKAIKSKKLIILGIPNLIQPEEVTEKILDDINLELPITIHKKIQREKAQTYQLVLEVDDTIALYLMKSGRLLIGFNSCKISEYRPVIRCANCQRYGHSEVNCGFQASCAYCTRTHNSSTCSTKNDPSKFHCVNCLHSDDYFPHSADSNKCPIYKYNLQRRNTFIKNFTSGSTR